MKTKLTLITLIACAAAGTTFAADPVRVFRSSSGTTTNSVDAVYVGNDVWGADSKTLGEKFFADLAAERGMPFEWDESKKAFYIGDSLGNSAHEKYWSFDAVFAIDGNAAFVNEAGATLTFRFVGDKGEQFDDFYEGYTVNNNNVVLLAGTSKFSNAGTLLWLSEFEDEDIPGLPDTPPHFEVYMRDEAVFENSGKIGSLSPSVMGILRDPASFTLFGNAKFVNAANGEIDGKFYAELYGNSVFENAGAVVDSTADDGTQSEFKLHENAKVVNTGTSEASVTFLPEKGDSSGTATFENRGKIVRGGEDDYYGFSVGFFVSGGGADALPEKSSGTFVNYGEISTASDNQKFEFGYVECAGSDGWLPSGDAEFEAYEEAFRKTVEASDWHVKNFGTIKGSPRVASGVELTLGEGSNITGDVVIGEAARVSDYFPYPSYSSSIRLDKDVLNIVLTGKGGSDALISGGLEVCNLVELNVSLAEDAVKKTKYELTIWGGELVLSAPSAGFVETTGTFSSFGSTYTWNLDTATGVLTATADPVRAFRSSSGTTTNSVDTVYVGNDVWGADSKTLGEKFFADLAAERGMPFEWDESKKAFYTGIDQDSFIVGPYGSVEYYDTKEYLAFDVVFALDGNASFVNEAGATLTFRYSGDKSKGEGDYDPETGIPTYFVENRNLILLAGTSKFSNAGTLLCESEFVSGDETGFAATPPHFEFYLRDEAVFENSGKLGNSVSNGRSTPWFILYGDSKFVNTATGEIAGDFVVELYGNSVFENAGTFGSTSETGWFAGELELRENAKFVNRGTFGTGSSNAMKEIFFAFQKGDLAGTAKFENRGKMSDMNINFNVNVDGHGELPTNLSASFENYGTISVANAAGIDINFDSEDYPQIDDAANVEVFIASYRDLLERSDLNVKNFGTISAPNSLIALDSGVKLTLGEGSNIDGDVAIGTQIRYCQDSREFRLDKDVLNIVLTGKGGSDALISGGLEVCNLVELNVSLAEDAVKKTKYELTIWGGELTLDETDSIYDPETGEHIPIHHDSGFIKTTGTLEGFGTTYAWSLDTATGVLTAKDVNIGEEIDLTSPTQNVELGEKDVATLDPSLTEYSGNVSGAGQVSSSGDVEFSGDASALTGTLSVDAGTFTVAESAKLGEKATLDVAGTLALEGDRTLPNTLSGAGTLETAGVVALSGDASAFSGTTAIRSGTLTVAESAKLGTGAFDVAGALALEGDRALSNTLSGAGQVSSSGDVEFSGDASALTGTLSVNAGTFTIAESAKLGEKATLDVAGTLALEGDRALSNTLSGAGQVSSSGDVEFSGDASALTGTLSVDAGTFTVAESAKLGEKATLDVAGTLALEGARTIANATSGAGAIELAAGATVKFAKEVGVKTLNVSDGATLRGGVKLTSGADAVLTIAGTLALDAAAGEKVALGTGKTVLAPTAKLRLDAAGGNAAGASFMAAGDAAPLENGGSVVIFENGTVEGDVVAFLGTDQTLAALAAESAVIYDATNGLSVQSLKNPSALTSYVDTSDLSSSFVGWALGGLEKDLANLQPGFVSKDDLGGLDSNDPLLNALLAGDAGTARSILDRLSPKSFAAMIAMPVETFHDDVRSVAARLEQRRHDAAAGVDGDWQFFAQAQMISAENDTASDAPTFDFDRYGALAGADVKLDETMLLGVAVGAGTGDADIHNGGGKIESTDFRALAYFGKTFAERFYVNAGAQLGFASYDVKRRSDYGDANADVDGWNAGAFAEAGAAFAISETHGLYATPYVGLAYAHAETDSFTESGSDRAAFDADALEGDSLRARIGCAFSWDFALASTAVRLGLDVAYSRELLDDEIDVDVRSGSDEISETAAALPEDVFSIGPTLDVALTASASVYAGYAFQAGTDSSTAHRANVGFRLRF